tara:strand:- start:51 stop:212 length:162 start_codon:yes stop_codon:yes gene_type:complete
MIRVKMFITMDIDPEEYPVPSDGNVSEEIEDTIHDVLYDIEGATIKNIRTLQE